MPVIVPIIAALWPVIVSALTALVSWLLKTALLSTLIITVLIVFREYWDKIIGLLADIAAPVLEFLINNVFDYNIDNAEEMFEGIVTAYQLANCWIPCDVGMSLLATYMIILGKVRGWKLIKNILPR